jgi:putative membrane protein
MILKLIVNAIALWFAAWLVDGMHLSESVVEVVIVALVFGLVNVFIKPVVLLLSLPLLLLSLGLFTFVINAAMLGLAAYLTAGLVVDSVGAALTGSLVVSVASLLLNLALKD